LAPSTPEIAGCSSLGWEELEDELLDELEVPPEEEGLLEEEAPVEEETEVPEELAFTEEEVFVEEEAVDSPDAEERKLELPLPPQPLKSSVVATKLIIKQVFFIISSAIPRYPKLGNRFPYNIIITANLWEKREIVKALSRKPERNPNETKKRPKPFANRLFFKDLKANASTHR
jgi:hypothetical protein